MSENEKLQRFGKYLILDHLVDGGMAKICRARFLGEQADKVVAIKMVQQQFSNDPAFKQMFMDELKVCFGLNHPNIAQTYDYGLQDGQLFTAMEYVDGANLKQFLDRLKARNYVFPVEISVYIVSQVCQALHYAHTFTDKLSGEKYNIVHRDISPHNIMINYDGAVKVIDFGIAKADTNSEATQAGTIKGKLSYLAPEYLEGLALDHRYDQFAVGITLWELLCSRKLFTAANDLAVLKQIQACKIPSCSSINPNVPKELDEIILKALSKDRENRFEDMDKFNRALVKFLYSKYPDFNPTDLAYFAKELFKEEIKKDREVLVQFGKVDISSYVQDLNNELEGGTGNKTKGTEPLRKESELEFKLEETDAKLTLDNRTKAVLEKTRVGAVMKKGPTVAGGANYDATYDAPVASGKTSTNTRNKIRQAGGTTTSAKIPRTVSTSSSGGMSKFLVMSLFVGVFGYMRPDLVKKFTGFDIEPYFNNGSRSLSSIDTSNVDVGQRGKVIIAGIDPLMEVYVDGKQVSYPLSGIDLSLNVQHQIKISKQGFEPYVVNVILTPENASQKFDVPPLNSLKVGLLSTSLNYPEGAIMKLNIFGEIITQKLPIDSMRVPAGTYEAVIVDPSFGTEKKVNFTIEENKRLFLE
ncbi:MAG: serine/threonine protein kinase [Bacteriovoracaceae bacterium]|nr:serine/threonine protein kinase [Bacteriovoracaceae bacterium]